MICMICMIYSSCCRVGTRKTQHTFPALDLYCTDAAQHLLPAGEDLSDTGTWYTWYVIYLMYLMYLMKLMYLICLIYLIYLMYLIFLTSLICPFNNLVTLAAVVCLVVRDTQDVQFPYAAGLLLLHSTRLKRLPMDERRARARRGRRTLHRMGACLIPTAEPQKLVPPDGGGGDGGDGGGGGGDGGSGGGGGGGGGSGGGSKTAAASSLGF